MYKEADYTETKHDAITVRDTLSKFQAEVKSPAIHFIRPNDVLIIHFALTVLHENNKVVTSGIRRPVLEEVRILKCVENIILNGQFPDYIVVC